VHVLTDGQWVPRNKERLPDMYFADGLLNTSVYYNDTFVTDFEFHRSIDWVKDVFDMLEKAVPSSNHPFLTFEEFDIWRHDILKTYAGECPMNNPVKFVTGKYVLDFVEESIPMIENTYRRAFE